MVHFYLLSLSLSLSSSVDNSEWMRNGDFIPTRLQSQQDAVNTVCHMKTRQNVENTVGLLSMAEYVHNFYPSIPLPKFILSMYPHSI